MSHHQVDNFSQQPSRLAHGPYDQALQPVPLANPQKASLTSSVDSDDTWNAAVHRWQAARMPHAAVLSAVRREVERFEACIGNHPLSGLTEAHVRHFIETCIVREKTSPRRVRGAVVLLASVVSTAIRGRVTPLRKNPFTTALKSFAPVTNDTNPFGHAFSTDELNQLYTSPLYVQGQLPRKGGLEAAFWLPLLGQFTGIRLERLCHLRRCDVVQHNGVWCLCLRVQRLHHPLEVRKVPLHSTLLELGWLDFVRTGRLSDNAAWLFPDLCVNSYGRRSATFAMWFKSYLDDSGLGGRRLTFHSFRSTFAAFAKRSGLCDDAVRQFLGFASGITAEGKEAAVEDLSFELLVQAMNRLEFPGLELDHLVRWRRMDR
ncbi:hypothetical protein FAZ95_03535 [Trinickia violacea]|uniref:Site-specific integrase n=1 Tax=Trinickia violacea TaxID=2571746 RepID=A0A4P8IKT3_9BURK|nr:tyrosine-type recombinase/integrase [Trinickia violacea]QCP48337.1 hypothetical protein FAZ95_03535 [Trinickia violacea]